MISVFPRIFVAIEFLEPYGELMFWLNCTFIRWLVGTKQVPESRNTSQNPKHFPGSKNTSQNPKHFPESKNTSQNPKHFPESKNTSRNPKHVPELKNTFQNPDLGCVLVSLRGLIWIFQWASLSLLYGSLPRGSGISQAPGSIRWISVKIKTVNWSLITAGRVKTNHICPIF